MNIILPLQTWHPKLFPVLKKFVSLSQTEREKNEKLEQLRALDNDMKIKVGLIDFLPLGVDTPQDLEEIKEILKKSIETNWQSTGFWKISHK